MTALTGFEIHPDFTRQEALEEEMRGMGIKRYWDKIEDSKSEVKEASTGPIKDLVKKVHYKGVEYIKGYLEDCTKGGAGKNPLAFNYLSNLDLDLCVHLAMKVTFDHLSNKASMNSVAMAVSNAIEDELHYQAFKGQKVYQFKKVVEKAKKSPSDKAKRRMVRETARKMDVKFDGFPQTDKMHLGTKLVEAVIHTGLIEAVRDDTYAMYTLVPTQETLDWLSGEHARREWLTPMYMPTVIPPKPWTTPFSGGYWTGRVRRLTLVKTPDRGYLERLGKHPMPRVYSAINALQDTAWQVNPLVWNTMETMYTLGLTHGGVMPSPNKQEAPTRPHDVPRDMKWEDMTEDQKERMTAWKREAAQVWEFNAKEASHRVTFGRIYDMAEKFADEPRIFFPHVLDFRGRMYPVPLFLNPQGTGEAKGLLRFADGFPLGSDEAVKWLAAHGAGCWGQDKIPFADRLAWVKAHQQDIIASAENPLDCLFWTTAEKPWMALAFCEEWAGYVQDGLDHVCHLNLQMDGTCNGLQHFSAMLLDEVGGASVNLLDSYKPNDIYRAVADEVEKLVDRDAAGLGPKGEEDVEHAQGWLGRITRSVTKRPTMTLSYGASKYGFTDQVFKDTVTPLKMELKEAFPWRANGYLASQYMGRTIWEATEVSLRGAKQAMQSIQQWATAASMGGEGMEWVTPSGFLAKQHYCVPSTKRIKMTFGDAQVFVTVQEDAPKVQKADHRKNAAGISPNFVHSQDASHMVNTIVAAVEAGIPAFSMIHDSYGCHACHAPLMARLLREQFVAMYEDGQTLDRFREVLKAYCSPDKELDPVPAKGNLDVRNVLKSQYFFH